MSPESLVSPYVNSREKRAVDITTSVLLLPFIIPTIGALALAIKLDDGGNPFFRQDRVGKHGKLFTLYKLRTFNKNTERTGIGKFIRPLGLDELPQIWNILKGQMSLIGIRALTPEDFEKTCNLHITDPGVIPQDITKAWENAYLAGRPGGLSLAITRAPSVLYRGFVDTHGIKIKMETDIEQAAKETFGMDLKIVGTFFTRAVDAIQNKGIK